MSSSIKQTMITISLGKVTLQTQEPGGQVPHATLYKYTTLWEIKDIMNQSTCTINRNLMLDLEPRVINKIQTSSYKNLYNSGQ